MVVWAGSLQAKNIETNVTHVRAFNVDAPNYAQAFAYGINLMYTEYPTDQYKEHKCRVIKR